MGRLLVTHGTPIGLQCSPMGLPWVSRGTSMGLPRVCYAPTGFHGTFVRSWCTDGQPMVLPYVYSPANGPSMGLQWGSDGFICLAHGFIVFTWAPMWLPWASHGSPMGLPWDHRAPIGLNSWVSFGSTIDSRGTSVPMGLPWGHSDTLFPWVVRPSICRIGR